MDNGIVYQIADDLSNSRRIHRNVRQPIGKFELQVHAGCGGPGPKRFHHRLQNRRQRDGLEFQAQCTRLGTRQQRQIINQLGQVRRLLMQRVNRGFVRRQHPVLDRLQIPPNVGQWRPQFVGNVGGHVAPLRIAPFQVFGHRVERRRQPLQFGWPAHRHALRQLAPTKSQGSPIQLRQRPQHPRCHQPNNDYSGQPGRKAADQQRFRNILLHQRHCGRSKRFLGRVLDQQVTYRIPAVIADCHRLSRG